MPSRRIQYVMTSPKGMQPVATAGRPGRMEEVVNDVLPLAKPAGAVGSWDIFHRYVAALAHLGAQRRSMAVADQELTGLLQITPAWIQKQSTCMHSEHRHGAAKHPLSLSRWMA